MKLKGVQFDFKLNNIKICIVNFAKSNLVWSLFLLIQVISYGAYPVLVNLSKVNGRLLYSTSSTNFLIEIFKLILSVFCICLLKLRLVIAQRKNVHEPFSTSSNDDDKKKLAFKLNDSWLYFIPGFLYFINNNLVMYMFYYMDSTTFQVLSNLKIFTTAILYYFIIGKKLPALKWFSLCLLFLAGIFYIFGNLKANAAIRTDSEQMQEMYITNTGVLMIILYSFVSGLAGVYSEYLLKLKMSTSIHVQNTYLYIYGVCLNYIAFKLSQQAETKTNQDGLTTGYNIYTWIGVYSQIFTGLAISVVMKHSSNITRLFIISSALIVNAALSIFILGLELNFYFIIAFLIILLAIALYLK